MLRGARMQPVTIYTRAGEDENGHARWAVTRVDGAYLARRAGVRQTAGQALQADDRAVLYLFRGAMPPGYVSPGDYDGAEGRWTLRGDGQDVVCVGYAYGETPPGDGSGLRVVRVMDHLSRRAAVAHLQAVLA